MDMMMKIVENKDFLRVFLLETLIFQRKICYILIDEATDEKVM